MATQQELIRRTNTITDDEFENIDLIDWFNQCQSEALAPILYIPTRADLAQVSTGLYTLPPNFKSDLSLVNSTSTFDIFGSELRVHTNPPTVLTIEYNRFPARITTNPTQVPEIPEPFHDLYIFYAAMMAMLMDEEHERYMYFREQFMAAYQGLKKHMDNLKALSRGTRVSTWVVIR